MTMCHENEVKLKKPRTNLYVKNKNEIQKQICEVFLMKTKNGVLWKQKWKQNLNV